MQSCPSAAWSGGRDRCVWWPDRRAPRASGSASGPAGVLTLVSCSASSCWRMAHLRTMLESGPWMEAGPRAPLTLPPPMLLRHPQVSRASANTGITYQSIIKKNCCMQDVLSRKLRLQFTELPRHCSECNTALIAAWLRLLKSDHTAFYSAQSAVYATNASNKLRQLSPRSA